MPFFASFLRSNIGIFTVAAVLAQAATVAVIEPEPVLKFVYFVPSNIAFDPTAYAAMQTTAADFAAWNRRYFNGNAPNYKVDYVLGDHTWEWYVYNREEYNRVTEGYDWPTHQFYFAMELSRMETIRKLDADPKNDKNVKYVIFMHEFAASEDTGETGSEPNGVAWMPYEDLLLVRTEKTKTPLLLANMVGFVWGLDTSGENSDCMRYGFNNANKTCNYSPSKQAKVLANYGSFFTGPGRNLATRLAPASCTARIGDDCTGTNGVRSCCPAEGYCQPVSSTTYQCMKRPVMCSDQLTDTDYYGNDLKEVMNVATAGDCCDLCSQTPGCRAYTYLFAGAPGINPKSCYLKTLAGPPGKSIGAVSGVILDDWSTGPCTARIGDSCNKNAVDVRGCCPSGSYCMPWSPTNYRCEAIPSQCSVQRLDTQYEGFDIDLVYTLSSDRCCDVCSQTQGCKAYTYYASATATGNAPVNAGSCYLKSNDQQITSSVRGAISGSAIIPKQCENKVGDSCAANPCCPSNAYCQPVGAGASQCVEKPAQCPVQQPNVDYFGVDVQTVKATSSEQCCEACSLNAKCNAYSYYKYTVPGREAGNCYLKETGGDQTSRVVGAVSAVLTNRLGCQAKIGGACGSDSCCPTGGYCQPQAGGTSQCLVKPAKCGVQLPNVEYTGSAIATLTDVASADKCCDACSQNPKCNAYSYYLFATGTRKAGTCSLQSTAGSTTASIGAVSGSKIERPVGCQGVIGGACGVDSCCPDGGFCQPLAGGKNQCVTKPAQCAVQFANLDYVGNDIKMVKAKSADLCCDACSANTDCNAYSFYMFATEGREARACYLKTAAGYTSPVEGAVSGSVVSRRDCKGKINEACGVGSCCPSDAYCQPLATGKNQCLSKPAQCGPHLANLDYIGNDVGMVTVSSASKCCEACSRNADCNVYSYYLFASEGRPAGACYLKSAAGDTTPVTGVVSGSVTTRS